MRVAVLDLPVAGDTARCVNSKPVKHTSTTTQLEAVNEKIWNLAEQRDTL